MVAFTPAILLALSAYVSARPAPPQEYAAGYAESAPAVSSAYDAGYSAPSNEYNSAPAEYNSAPSSGHSSAPAAEYSSAPWSESGSYSSAVYVEAPQSAAPQSSHATPTGHASSPAPSHGSGSSNWQVGGEYDSCVQTCIKEHGAKPAEWAPSPVQPESEGSKGTGATHTVIVAPSQGVLRYVPFHVNASIGDTVKFMWGANNHTVTRGSSLQPCNKTAEEPSFTSGLKVKDFVYTQVVNTTEPTYFFCNAPTHCQKGMFGMINPPMAAGSSSSYEKAVVEMAKTNPDIAAEWTYSNEQTKSSPNAAAWGANLNMSALPEWAQKSAAENTMYTKIMLAANPEVWTADGKVDLGLAGTNPMMIPADISLALNNAAAAPAGPVAPAAPVGGAPAAEESAAPEAAGAISTSGAGALAPSALVAVVAVAMTFFAL